MLTDLDFLNIGQSWPPKDADTVVRLETYAKNKLLFEGKHDQVFTDLNRLIREDQVPTLEISLNWHKRLSTTFSSFLWGETPNISSTQDNGSYLNSIIEYNNLNEIGYEVTLDTLRYGTGLFKIGYDGTRGTIDAQNPAYWHPIFHSDNLKRVQYHVLAWSFDENDKKGQRKTYLRAEIHSKGKIENRLYQLENGKITEQIKPISSHPRYSSLKDEQKTGIEDFLLIPVHNLQTSDNALGLDDYEDINTIIEQIELRICQITRILNKHSDPNMAGSESCLQVNPDTNEATFVAGGKFFPMESGESYPQYIVWDGKLEAAYSQIELLLNQLYSLAEVSPILFGDPQKLQRVDSGAALKRLLISTLAKVNRLKLAIDPQVKKALKITSKLETLKRVPDSMELKDISIEWQDGLPQDELEAAQIMQLEAKAAK